MRPTRPKTLEIVDETKVKHGEDPKDHLIEGYSEGVFYVLNNARISGYRAAFKDRNKHWAKGAQSIPEGLPLSEILVGSIAKYPKVVCNGLATLCKKRYPDGTHLCSHCGNHFVP